jgi:hypothetical protein
MGHEMNALRVHIARRNDQLQTIAAELKGELYGIDDVIDRVIDSVRAWFVLPEIISRPVIVCLWGLTGTGKTQLTRSLARKLGFYDRFVEVQMDGFSNDIGSGCDTISGMLSNSAIAEGAPGILVLDEFQRYRTIDHDGDDIKVQRYVDVWTLLSDGRLPPSLAVISELEMSLASSHYREDRKRAQKSPDDDVLDFDALTQVTEVPGSRFTLSPYRASELKCTLKLQESLLEVMAFSALEIHERLVEFRAHPESWETDYSKLLIFVCGNLDEMYAETAKRVEDCDTDADIFHQLTQRLNIIDVKRSLATRFRPEQIARLGNNHVIYPSFNRATYQHLIEATCRRYTDEICGTSKLDFVVSGDLLDEIYRNAVFPAQGTRPLFSSIHALLSAPLVNFTLWALEHGARAATQVSLTVDDRRQHLVARFGDQVSLRPVCFELNRLRQRDQPDFRALLSVHEAGHGLIYALLFLQAPQEIKINAATFAGGYNRYLSQKTQSARNVLDSICVVLGGRAAETMVFGDESCSNGSENDLTSATAMAAQYIRHWGFGSRLSRSDVAKSRDENINTDILSSNDVIEEILQRQFSRAKQLLKEHVDVFRRMTRALANDGEIAKETLAQWLGLPSGEVCHPDADQATIGEQYARKLQEFDSDYAGSVTALLLAA